MIERFNADVVRLLYDYNYWAHRKVWACDMQLTDAQFTRDLGWSHGSIHGQVVHTMSAEWIWFSRLRGTSPEAVLSQADFPTRADVRARWDAIEAEARAYLDTLTDATLGSTFHYKTTRGQPQTNRVWEVLLHLVNHGTDHRAQTMAMLNQLGAPTVEQDLMHYLREKEGAS